MTGTCAYAASVARGCVADSQEFRKLSSMMCWDAVTHCALLAGIIDQNKYKLLKGYGRHTRLIRTSNTVVANAGAMAIVPQGHIIGFFEDQTMIHVMLSTGFGMAAGNKNDCVGVGRSVGWQVVNLQTGLKWVTGGHIKAPRGPNNRGVIIERDVNVYHRPITDLRFA